MQSTKRQIEAKDEIISNFSKIVTNGSQEDKDFYNPLIKIHS